MSPILNLAIDASKEVFPIIRPGATLSSGDDRRAEASVDCGRGTASGGRSPVCCRLPEALEVSPFPQTAIQDSKFKTADEAGPFTKGGDSRFNTAGDRRLALPGRATQDSKFKMADEANPFTQRAE